MKTSQGNSMNRDSWNTLLTEIENYQSSVESLSIVPSYDLEAIRKQIDTIDFQQPISEKEAIHFICDNLKRYQLQCQNPGYIGLYVPTPIDSSAYADAISSGFNCQLASWRGAPFAIELEMHLIRFIGSLFHLPKDRTYGMFTSGGSEANHTAVISALAYKYGDFGSKGLRALTRQPVGYCSSEAHHSLHKSFKVTGLGEENLHEIGLTEKWKMDVDQLEHRIESDIKNGQDPFLLIATLGTTNSGTIDSLSELTKVAKKYNMWLHVDAAYGGGGAFSSKMKDLFQEVHSVDSICFDPHKWFSTIGLGLFLTRHQGLQEKAFGVNTPYISKLVNQGDVIDPYKNSLQWSRRFLGLKLFLPLVTLGHSAITQNVDSLLEMGDHLKDQLKKNSWKIENDTPLPVACFTDCYHPNANRAHLESIVREVNADRDLWISTTQIGAQKTVIRACVINRKTEKKDILRLVNKLGLVREKLKGA